MAKAIVVGNKYNMYLLEPNMLLSLGPEFLGQQKGTRWPARALCAFHVILHNNMHPINSPRDATDQNLTSRLLTHRCRCWVGGGKEGVTGEPEGWR